MQMQRYFAVAVLLLTGALGFAAPALGDDWPAGKLRGGVFVNDPGGDNKWVPLARGDVVSDARYIRTTLSGHVELTRGSETIDLAPNTQLRIVDRSGQHFTTVKEDFGQVTVSADVEKVKHFAVETPFLVAVVKGTQFSVISGASGAIVKVQRGLVGVTDLLTRRSVDVPAGEQLSASTAGEVTLSGKATGSALPGEDGVGVVTTTGLVIGTVGGVGNAVADVAGTIGGVARDAATSGAVHDVAGAVGGIAHGLGSLAHP